VGAFTSNKPEPFAEQLHANWRSTHGDNTTILPTIIVTSASIIQLPGVSHKQRIAGILIPAGI
jgi:hypothetical protein